MVEGEAWSFWHLPWFIYYPKILLLSHEVAVEWTISWNSSLEKKSLKHVSHFEDLCSWLSASCSWVWIIIALLRSIYGVFYSVQIMKLLKLTCFPMALSFERAGVWGGHGHSTRLINVPTDESQGLKCFSQLCVDASEAKVSKTTQCKS